MINMINLDKEKLKANILMRGMSYAQVSKRMGMNNNYIEDLLRSDSQVISLPCYKLLCYVFNVNELFFLKSDKPKADDTPKADDMAAQLAQIATELQELRKELAELTEEIEIWRCEK